ncbi:MAG: AEC family transporter, partial [Sedimentisphaerales bacterium]|nr:AEC family transporter [Sedimentisphaerales bacterium]
MYIFVEAFSSTFVAVMQVCLIIVAAWLLAKKKIITQDHILTLTHLNIKVFLPCLIVSVIITDFDPGGFKWWWTLPLASVVMVAIGLLFGLILFGHQCVKKKNMLGLASFQNSGYFILPIGKVLYPAEADFDTFAKYCFLYILLMGIILWALGKYLCTEPQSKDLADKNSDYRTSLKNIINPPLVANMVALALVFTGLHKYLLRARFVLDSAHLLGAAAIPLATFILGGVLGTVSFKIKPYILDALRVILIKLILLPLVTI